MKKMTNKSCILYFYNQFIASYNNKTNHGMIQTFTVPNVIVCNRFISTPNTLAIGPNYKNYSKKISRATVQQFPDMNVQLKIQKWLISTMTIGNC